MNMHMPPARVADTKKKLCGIQKTDRLARELEKKITVFPTKYEVCGLYEGLGK